MRSEQKTVIKAIVDKSTARVSSIAQTERTRAKSSKALEHADYLKGKGHEVEYVVSLSPDHDIVDICDDLHGVYSNPPPEGFPPYHPNCICKLTTRIKQ